MTYTIKVNCRKIGIGLLTTLWIASSFFSAYSAYLNYLTSQSYDAQNDCHFNYVENVKACNSIWVKNRFTYDIMGSKPAPQYYFVYVEYGMIVVTILIQVGAFLILNSWKNWIDIECISHHEIQNLRADKHE